MICFTERQPSIADGERDAPRLFHEQLEEAIDFLDSGELAETDGYQVPYIVPHLRSAFINVLAHRYPERAARLGRLYTEDRPHYPRYADQGQLAKVKGIEALTRDERLTPRDAKRLRQRLSNWWRELALIGGCSRELAKKMPWALFARI
ncbi:MAG: hypothetical protein ACYTG0_03625 [Planctomycetota bacterium]|jgi:hypothetical protein